MASKRGSDWIPNRDDDFFTKQHTYVDRVDANKSAWGIPAADVQTLKDLRQEYEPLYHKSQNKNSRTSGDVVAHRDRRKRYEKAWRAFHKEWVLNNRRIPKSELFILVGKELDTEPSPRPKINDIPFVGFSSVGGGSIEVTCKRETDQNRPSIHPDADVIECRYILAPVKGMPPNDPDQCQQVTTSTKAHFFIACGAKNAGLCFYGFFRWVNLTNPANNGPWSYALAVVIA